MGFFAFQIFIDIAISIGHAKCHACNQKSQSVEPGVELTETCFLALNLILSLSKLGCLSWTVKYTFNTLKTQQRTI